MNLSSDLLDYYLLVISCQTARKNHMQKAGNVFYAGIYAIPAYGSIPLIGSRDLRRRLLLPVEGHVPMVPVLFVVKRTMDYWLVLFDYKENHVFIMGSPYGSSQEDLYADWTGWQGKGFWYGFANVFQWRVEEDPSRVMEVTWVQVSLRTL
jgi:hypothetical protein